MKIIKRYNNRKFYDTTKSRYINLTEIGALIRSPQEFKVINNVSKKDITLETAYDAASVFLRGQLSLEDLACALDIVAGSYSSDDTAERSFRDSLLKDEDDHLGPEWSR